jgi:hypothetical protein
LRIVVEGAVIVVSVLMAFGIEAWWDRAQDRAAAEDLLVSLRTEVEFNLSQLAEAEAALATSRGAGESLLAMTAPDAGAPQPFLVDSLLAATFYFATFHPATGSITDVLNGQLHLIGSGELRHSIARWEEQVRDLREDEGWALNEFVLSAFPAVAGEVPVYTGANRTWAEAAGPDARREVLRRLDFANRLGFWVWRLNGLAGEHADFRAYLEGMLALIETEGS